MQPKLYTILFLSFSLLLFSCAFVPINNQFEKAGTLKKGNFELAGNLSRYIVSGGSESEATNTNVGFRAGLGLADGFDVKLRYEHMAPTMDFARGDIDNGHRMRGTNFYSLIPKIALVPETVALLVPISHYSFMEEWGEEKTKGYMNSIAPQLLYTFTGAKQKGDLTLGVKADCLFSNDGAAVLLSATVGAGFSKNLNKWAIRPEIGASYLGGGSFISYGVGFQYLLSKKANL